ncbi:CDP-glycerol glycerophosphotransferase family protein [uncultured Ilyobacter sp.]|uniref:CDP-glycerol glycerophosphotransferase family protein n=1 Tax=uncultured Ilyobacter sp. TaxID=544433 RepID=UPI0029F520C7|nr:CDP-glycerol glycerophosphotransferase family protein [uncultured Ilyobacter sp.]
MKRTACQLIQILDNLTLKKNRIIFHSYPDYSDNSYALFKYFLKKKLKYEIIWLVDKCPLDEIKEKIKKEFGVNIKVYKKSSVSGILSYLSSKYVFFTHGLYGGIVSGKNKKRINLWHGMQLKRMGKLDKKDSLNKNFTKQDFVIATSNLYKDINSEMFNLKKSNVLITGQPRNDLLFEDTNFFKKTGINSDIYKKLIIWMPTYRNAIDGKRNDGLNQKNYISIFKISELEELNEFLKKMEVFLLIKIHPMDIINKLSIKNYSNLLVLKSGYLQKINEQLYPLLGKFDALITDYSSVYVDFLILNRPIAFVNTDEEQYSKYRGFVFKNYKEYMPGEFIKTKQSFYKFIQDLVNEKDKYYLKRSRVNKAFNKYFDNKSCERLIEKLKL